MLSTSSLTSVYFYVGPHTNHRVFGKDMLLNADGRDVAARAWCGWNASGSDRNLVCGKKSQKNASVQHVFLQKGHSGRLEKYIT